jgi:hypothetical protein
MALSTTKGKQSKPRRIMLYGVHGIGKSSFAASAPNAVFLPTEDGVSDIDCESFPLAETFEQFDGYLQELAGEEHDRQTLVIDTLDWLERLIWGAVEAEHEVNSIEDIGYAKGYTFALKQWRHVLRALDWLRDNKGMTCLLLAHAKIEKFQPPDNDPFDRYSPKMHKLASAIVQEWCDEVMFANYRVFTKTQGEGFDKRTQGVGSGERIVHTSERPSHLAKNRANLPETLPLSWQEYEQAISF